MKKFLQILLLLSVTVSLNATTINYNFSDQATIVSTNSETVSSPVKHNTVANTADPITITFLEVNLVDYPNSLNKDLDFNFKQFLTYFSKKCNLKLHYLNAIPVSFKTTDIAYPFHTHL
ncbi:hypothetical protein FHS04_001919 [Mesoflavibacter sabulilitoris]|uniref:Uncharacterized protein n=1 Tax=Mesoflavibacter zeaxanthinifaciens subsp. sabulilitoris TaxID=1520893 RepID=A0A2T1NHW0_9FLAO|nr:hypothetical protein [Mesoflavibacter zeaxanthinifaciens]MBB3124401.1 hypothetical protein [Mesoflavibacter zeaxanthinifaciens subsp. sabulilitoris]PSG92501.1 hypothetical protein C7H61_03405 [Mesoflavibacter zeaxanthinifaciens subsp. sabulilitoris]